MRFSPLKYQIFIFMIALFTAVLAIIFLVIIPTTYQILDLRDSIKNMHGFIENQYQKTKHTRRSVHDLSETALTVKKFSQATIQEGSELSVITTFERLAAEHQVKQALKVAYTGPLAGLGRPSRAMSNPNQFGFYTFSFALEGTYAGLLSYLRAAETLPFYLVIDSLRWEKNTDNSQLIHLRFDGRIFTSPI